jgi:hypothetical protein
MWTVLYWTRSSRTHFGVSINVWGLAVDTLNITYSFLHCNHQVNTEFWSPCITRHKTYAMRNNFVMFLMFVLTFRGRRDWNSNLCPGRGRFGFVVLVNAFTTYGAPRPVACTELRAHTVHLWWQRVKSWKSIQRNESCILTYLLTYVHTYLLNPCSRALLENLIGSQVVKKSPPYFMEPDGSLPQSQESGTCPYPEPDRSSQRFPKALFEYPF